MGTKRRRQERVSAQASEGDLSGEQAVWQQWIRDLGRQLRRRRELAGLSQDQLARRAGVSQGAVSRLEMARGLATPLLIVVKINLVLARELGNLDQTILDADRTLDIRDALRSLEKTLRPDAPRPTSDRDFTALVRLYRETPAARREGLLAIVKATAAALQKSTEPDPSPPRSS